MTLAATLGLMNPRSPPPGFGSGDQNPLVPLAKSLLPDVGVHYIARIDIVDSLRAAGLHPEVVWADLHAHYASQALTVGWGSFYTWDEVIAFLDSLHAAHPDITTPRFSIGQSIEGRDLWAMKISDHPAIDEDEPEVYFDSAHHAREVITPLVTANTMRWLADGYGTDPEATFLVNEREIWFVPVVSARVP